MDRYSRRTIESESESESKSKTIMEQQKMFIHIDSVIGKVANRNYNKTHSVAGEMRKIALRWNILPLAHCVLRSQRIEINMIYLEHDYSFYDEWLEAK